MNKKNYQNKVSYLILFTGLILGLVAFFGLFSLPQLRQESIIGLCMFYFLWGICHHWWEKNLRWQIALEYFLVASIAGFLLLSLIWRV